MPRLLAVLAVLTLLTACKKSDHAGHTSSQAHPHAHVHIAPHGGALIELGNHQFNLELLLDSASGRLTAWVLDAHAENFVRISAPAIELAIQSGGITHTLTLLPIANAATGETVGSTSQFEAAAGWLRSGTPVMGLIRRVEIRGLIFTDVPFRVTPAAARETAPHSRTH